MGKEVQYHWTSGKWAFKPKGDDIAHTKMGGGRRINDAEEMRRKGERRERRKAGTEGGKEGLWSGDEDMKWREFQACPDDEDANMIAAVGWYGSSSKL